MKKQNYLSIISFTIITIILSNIFPLQITAQIENNNIDIGTIVSIDSKILGEQRNIFVYLPVGYDQTETKYPVIYILDGRANFFFSAATVNFLSRNQRMPRSIVIGIPNTDRMRDFSPVPTEGSPTSGGADKFLEFMEKELIPFVDNNYRTQDYKTLFGHSLCGMFSIYTLFEKPEMFNSFISVSPYLQYADQYVIDRVESAVSERTEFNKYLFITLGNEPAYTASLDRIEKLLSNKTERLSWEISIRESEDHGTVPLKSLYDGLEFIYSGWLLTDEIAMSGVHAIIDHYSSLSSKFGYPVQISEITANMIGYRLMQNDELEKAIDVFKYNVKLYPNSANVYDSLGDATEKSGDTKAAADYYRTAVKFGAITNDPNQEIYKRNLDRVQALN